MYFPSDPERQRCYIEFATTCCHGGCSTPVRYIVASKYDHLGLIPPMPYCEAHLPAGSQRKADLIVIDVRKEQP